MYLEAKRKRNFDYATLGIAEMSAREEGLTREAELALLVRIICLKAGVKLSDLPIAYFDGLSYSEDKTVNCYQAADLIKQGLINKIKTGATV